MRTIRIAAALVLLTVLVAPPLFAEDGAASETKSAFFTEGELGRIDEALDLLNMKRSDLEFDKQPIEDDWRLPVVRRTLEKPLESADVLEEWGKKARGEPGMIALLAMKELNTAMEGRGEPLSDEERERLERWAYAALVSEDSHDGLIPKPESEEDAEAMLALARREGDRALLVDVALRILDSLPWLVDDALAGEVGEGRRVKIGTPGDDVHDLSGPDAPYFLIDPGGNDTYIAPARATAEHDIAVVVDLGGDDTYGAGESLSCGAALFGVAILWDRGDGNDVYHSGHLSQGCGVFGVGMLIDEGGEDVYRAKDTAQGAGAWGIGLLLDRGEGNDLFHADLFGQGFAYVGGFGLLHNESGNDVYDAGGTHLHYPLYNDRYQSLSQGFSIGMRPHASGGIGLLVDDAGNDRYAADIYGQGASYWFSYGGLLDSGGNDTYLLGHYGQGAGIHLSVGCLIDLAGEDLYYNQNGVGTGGAHDWAVGILVDRLGNDYYAGSGGTQGGALTNSFALLLDGSGDDGYSAVRGRHVTGGGRAARGMGSIGLFLDLGGTDMIGTREANGSVWTRETYGAGMDVDSPAPTPAGGPGRDRLTPEEAAARVRERAFDEEAGDWDLDELWAISCEWPVGEMADVVPVALDRLEEIGEPAMEKALAAVGTKQSLEFLAVQSLLKRFGDAAVPSLVEMLSGADADTARRAATLVADLGAREAIPHLVPLLGMDKAKTSALDALARLDAKDEWEAVTARLTDETERVRVAAVRCLQSLGATDAIPALMERLSGDEIFTVRFAAEDVLVGFGRATLPALRALAGEEADVIARRHAIRALGRISDGSTLTLLAELAGHEDWRIRRDATEALRGFLGGANPAADRAEEALRKRALEEPDPRVRSRNERR